MWSGVPLVEGRLDLIETVIDMTRYVRLKTDRLGQARVLMPPGLIAFALRLISGLIAGLISGLISRLLPGLISLVPRLIALPRLVA